MLSKKSVFISIPFLNKKKKTTTTEQYEVSKTLLDQIEKNREAFIKAINEKHSKTK